MGEYQDQRADSKSEYDKQRYSANRDEMLARVKGSYDPKKKSAYDRYNRKKTMRRRRGRYRTDINYKLTCNLRARLYGALKRGRKSASTLELLGCSVEYLRSHIESLFTEGMSWTAVMDGRIQIDHIRPCASFNLTDPEQQKACFNYKNLQPLWKPDNQRKYTKLADVPARLAG